MTSRERRRDLSFPLPFHERSSKLRTFTKFCCRVSELLSSVRGHPGIYTMIFIRRFLCVDTLKCIWRFFIRRFVIEFRDKLFCVWTHWQWRWTSRPAVVLMLTFQPISFSESIMCIRLRVHEDVCLFRCHLYFTFLTLRWIMGGLLCKLVNKIRFGLYIYSETCF